ncbi:MAG: SAM-dependent chlorinase/fluorinase [Pirellulales bacterium]
MPPIITLTTDFGSSSRYVAAMKGVILSISPNVRLIDITHSIPRQDIRAGGIALAETAPYFPAGTIHVAVVDPGVGTDRRIIYVEIGDGRYIAPDNGLLSQLAARQQPRNIREVVDPRFWRPTVSATFHGRDIMAPVAAHLSLGISFEELGRPLSELTLLPLDEVTKVGKRITGKVVEIDSFGNLMTDISRDALASVSSGESVRITCDEHQTLGIFRTYADQPEMTFIALIGSSDRLELAIVGENAAAMLGVRVDTPVVVEW